MIRIIIFYTSQCKPGVGSLYYIRYSVNYTLQSKPGVEPLYSKLYNLKRHRIFRRKKIKKKNFRGQKSLFIKKEEMFKKIFARE